ncbi:amidohydrolase family protein [Klebsiella variicola]|uniref:Amidohydrolase family protein n=1 Tax=Klebsiella variicola TaxID=244366 RepID=A0A7H4MCP6_KLEVA|nr:amidohydrolase family protein [Klebsiella variicola]
MGQAVPAMYYSASATVMVDFHGKAAHAARPHLGINALDAASHAVQAVNGIHLAPSLTWSAKADALSLRCGRHQFGAGESARLLGSALRGK